MMLARANQAVKAMTPSRANIYLGLGCVAFALLTAFVWVPLDSDTGLIEQVRRRVAIGDALAPTIAAGFVGLGGLILLVSERRAEQQPALKLENVLFIFAFLCCLAVALTLMRWAGPLAAALFSDAESYRLLRDTAPWKWIGFGIGGAGLVAVLISAVERRFTWRALLIGLAFAALLICIFDLPFDDLLLPPNGDV